MWLIAPSSSSGEHVEISYLPWLNYTIGKQWTMRLAISAIGILNPLDIYYGTVSTRDVWSQSCIAIQKLSIASDHFLEIWLTRLRIEELDEATYTFYLIWQRHNVYVFQHKFRHPNSIILEAKSEVNCFSHSLQQVTPSSTPRPPAEIVKWKRPPPNFYKLNGMQPPTRARIKSALVLF